MIAAIIAFITALTTPSSDALALQRTAPAYLDAARAQENLGAARIAARMFDVDAELLLSIAWHESRYEAHAVGPEAGGRVSCGVMTPEPVAHCTRTTALDGYVAGARHLRDWMNATHDLRAALLGYAGGWRMIKACGAGPVLRRGGAHDDLCFTPQIFTWRRDWIRRERARVAPGV